MKIHTQLHLRLPQPTIYGPKDYRELRSILTHIDKVLIESHAEDKLILSHITKLGISEPSQKNIENVRRALRCSILKTLFNLDYRELSVRLADSNLYQWFTGYNTLTTRKTPAKSTLERYCKTFSPHELDGIITGLLNAVSSSQHSELLLNRETPLSIDQIFADTTCVKADIHFPVDWVLLRDGVRSLVKAIICIRKAGLKHRIPNPKGFISTINKHCIAMTHCRRTKDSKKRRKMVLREMKHLSKVVEQHGQRYRYLLDTQWGNTSWSRPQVEQVLKRIDNVLEKLPTAIAQAHERIIGGRMISSKEKILSLYDDHTHVIVRGKAGAEVEFGNGVYLAEQEDGLIVDWEIFEDQPPSDCKIVTRSIKRITDNFGKPETFTADRGFSSKKND